jgi:hemolysin activation/secretion protein
MILPGACLSGFLRRWLAWCSLAAGLVSPVAAAQGDASSAAATNAPARSSATATNAGPTFWVQGYEVHGNTLLSEATLKAIFARHTGTRVTKEDIFAALKDLQLEYHARGYDTITVTFPQQKIINGIFNVQVFEGHLAEIVVKGNRYYSSNNIMRALPGLRTNMILNSKLFQPELDRANANQDRQIFPEIHPGPETNTTSLFLTVKDRVPFHVKIEANNQSSPGTPEMRLNTSAVYGDLWQLDHSLGFQYSFSEEEYKDGNQWEFYDRPLVANYSAFYRLPLAAPESLADMISSHPANFGYNEATRKFELPEASGTPELNLYASRSTIDTGVTSGAVKVLSTTTSGSIAEGSDHQDWTFNDDLGFRYSQPLPEFDGVRSRVQAGLDYKTYQVSSFATNNFIFTQYLFDTAGNPFTRVSITPSPVPASVKLMDYIPLSFRWDADRLDNYGSTAFGFSYSPNLYFSGGSKNVQNITGSGRSSGYWQILGASLAREQIIHGDWKLSLRADGQWSSEPLIPNEQFGVGGVNGVGGYREGEVFGDTGWRVTSEFKTPSHRIGFIGKGTGTPLTVRASAFLDYANTWLLDPQGRPGNTPLLGAGFGGAASVNPNFEGRLMFAWPFLDTATSEAGQIHISFALNAQF